LRSRGPPLPIFAVAFLVDVAFVHFYFSFHYFICLFICERRMIRPNVLVGVRATSQREKSYNTEMAVAFCSYTPFVS
jgi:hypothetical protein